MKKSVVSVSPETRTLLIERHGQRQRITIPSDWRVTFAVGGGASKYGNGTPERDLRIYEAGEHCRAVFTGVSSFRDISIPVETLIKSKTGEESWEDDGQGNLAHTSKTKTKKDWIAE
jgi:hypothetical protein